ncbi:MAG: HlyC/CorC family transporter [Bacteroidetes bacterium]|nr:MAG: HlyC/CorC family transporter [Bacteroidota bacterium]
MLIGLILIVILVTLNGFFVAAEFAMVKVRTSQLAISTKEGSRLRKITDHIIKNLEAYLAATQLGITIASLALGWIGEEVAHKGVTYLMSMVGIDIHTVIAHQIAIVLSFTFVTSLHVIFGEMIPKNVAIRHPLQLTLFLAIPLRVCYILFIPFVQVANGLANWILLKFGIQASNHGHEVHSMDELQLIIENSVSAEQHAHAHTHEDKEHKSKKEHNENDDSKVDEQALKMNKISIIQRVLKFDDLEVRKAAITGERVFMIDADKPFKKLVEEVIMEGYSRIPVYKGSADNIIGVLYTKDLMRLWQDYQKKPNEEINIKQILKKPYYVREHIKLGEVLQKFQQKALQFAVVINDDKKFVGVITMEDILEEFLGEIYDEYDALQDILMPAGENEFIVNGLARLSNLNEMLPERMPEGLDYDTLSGLVIHECGKIPSISEIVTIGNYEIQVTKHNKRRIQTAMIKWNKK